MHYFALLSFLGIVTALYPAGLWSFRGLLTLFSAVSMQYYS